MEQTNRLLNMKETLLLELSCIVESVVLNQRPSNMEAERPEAEDIGLRLYDVICMYIIPMACRQ